MAALLSPFDFESRELEGVSMPRLPDQDKAYQGGRRKILVETGNVFGHDTMTIVDLTVIEAMKKGKI
jgi:hypothetical protein